MSSELVTVATFNDPIQAAMARNYLEAGGVRAFLLDELTVTTDWGLGNAVGGIKLQVSGFNLERAEALLGDLPGNGADDEVSADVVDTAITTPETADELREEHELHSAKNQAVDRLFRATVFGLIFWPLQFYALWLLLTLPNLDGNISANQRWKVGTALLLNIPLLGLVFILLALACGLLGGNR